MKKWVNESSTDFTGGTFTIQPQTANTGVDWNFRCSINPRLQCRDRWPQLNRAELRDFIKRSCSEILVFHLASDWAVQSIHHESSGFWEDPREVTSMAGVKQSTGLLESQRHTVSHDKARATQTEPHKWKWGLHSKVCPLQEGYVYWCYLNIFAETPF